MEDGGGMREGAGESARTEGGQRSDERASTDAASARSDSPATRAFGDRVRASDRAVACGSGRGEREADEDGEGEGELSLSDSFSLSDFSSSSPPASFPPPLGLLSASGRPRLGLIPASLPRPLSGYRPSSSSSFRGSNSPAPRFRPRLLELEAILAREPSRRSNCPDGAGSAPRRPDVDACEAGASDRDRVRSRPEDGGRTEEGEAGGGVRGGARLAGGCTGELREEAAPPSSFWPPTSTFRRRRADVRRAGVAPALGDGELDATAFGRPLRPEAEAIGERAAPAPASLAGAPCDASASRPARPPPPRRMRASSSPERTITQTCQRERKKKHNAEEKKVRDLSTEQESPKSAARTPKWGGGGRAQRRHASLPSAQKRGRRTATPDAGGGATRHRSARSQMPPGRSNATSSAWCRAFPVREARGERASPRSGSRARAALRAPRLRTERGPRNVA